MSNDSFTRNILTICDDAMAQPAADRAEFVRKACGNDTRLQRAVESVLGAITVSEERFADSGLSMDGDPDAMIGKSLGGYHITASLGQGGMGSVYLAERNVEDFVQQVAIKIVRGRFVASELVERFNAERKILASLNHPYIANLIDGGTAANGVPYLVMEYVEGIPVDEYLDDHKIDLKGRIRLIQKIAQAVHAAHQNLVVHRDLKPSNVLVTADGIPKLLDFGIAKLIADDDTSDSVSSGSTTVFGQQALTPDYASPEQMLEGKVTTASDVYSLGILAYQLLTGERPYTVDRTSHQEMLNSVNSITVPRPSSRLDTVPSERNRNRIASARATTPDRLRRQLQGDLDNILIKALQKEAGDRYGSVAAFSADLDRYLAGMPVEAHAQSVAYRFSRFVSRNRLAVGFSALALVLLFAGLGGTTWAYLQAETARNDANARFDQVRSLARTLMFDIYDDIEKIPGTLSTRQTLAATTQTYLASLTTAENVPDDVALDAAQGYARLAAILNGQAVNDPASREQSLEAWQQADALLNDLLQRQPDSVATLQTRGQLYSSRASQLTYNDNDAQAAREAIAEASSSFDRANQLAPDDKSLEADRLKAQQLLADTYKWQQDYEQASTICRELLADITAAKQRWPGDFDILKIEGDVLQLLGESRYFVDDTDNAVTHYSDSIAAYNAIIENGGGSDAVNAKLVTAHWSRGNTLVETDRPAEGAVDYRAAMDIVEVVVARDPDDTSAARRLAILRGSNAMALVTSGEYDEAVRLMTETNDWFEAQAAADPETPGVQRSLAVSYHMMGDILQNAERNAEACTWYRKTADLWVVIDSKFGLSDFDKGQPERLAEIIASDCDASR